MCACQRMQGAWNPLIRLANRSTPSPQFGIVVFEQMNCSNTRCLIEPAPALFCHRQGRYSGSRLGEGFYSHAVSCCLAGLSNHRQPPRIIRAPNPRPRGSGQRSWTQGWRSQTGGEKCRDDWAELAPDQAAQIFPCRGGRQVARATPCFHSIDFYVTAQPSLILSLYAPRYCLTASAGFGRQFTKLRALSRLRRRYGSKKVPFSSSSSYIFSANSASAAATAWRRISPRSPTKRCSRARTPSGPA